MKIESKFRFLRKTFPRILGSTFWSLQKEAVLDHSHSAITMSSAQIFDADDLIEAINFVELLDDTWSSSWEKTDRQRGRQEIIVPWIFAEGNTLSKHSYPVRHQRGLQAALQRERERQRRVRSPRPTGVRRILCPRSLFK